MTQLGEYFQLKCTKQAEVARKTGLSTARINQLVVNDNAVLKASELYLIAIAINVSPCDLLEALYGYLKLESNDR